MIELSEFGYIEGDEAAQEFDQRYGTALSWHEIARLGNTIVPRLAKLNAGGETEKRVTRAGSDYMLSRVDYFPMDNPERVRASRGIKRIMSGQRTELAFWNAIDTSITVHQGEGMFMVGKPNNNNVKTFMIDSEIIPSVQLASQTFYVMRAGRWGQEPLVVSNLHLSGPHDDPEIIVEHDPATTQDTIETPQGPIKVPMEFNILYELRNC